jgi:hypothetical protein
MSEVKKRENPILTDKTDNPIHPESLPCLNSNRECIEQLTAAAIANSNQLLTLDEKISLIDRRLKLMSDRIDYSQKKSWTNYVTIDPVKLLQNLFGGGDVQKDKIAIADLEIKTADLEAAKAELERQREEEKTSLSDRVLHLLLDYEEADRKYALIQSQLDTFNQQQDIFEISYRLGFGDTAQMLGLSDKGDRLNEQLVSAEIKRDESVRELGQLTGYEIK